MATPLASTSSDDDIDPDAAKLAAEFAVADSEDDEPTVQDIPATETVKSVSDEDIKAVDLNIDKQKSEEASIDIKDKDDKPMPNIWSFDADEEKDEDKFDKPSFLRRLKRRKKDDETDKK